MKEEFLHYLWKTKNIELSKLKSVNGQDICIHQFGHHNHDAGPDFLDAVVEIAGSVWHGHIEIHKRASDWINHKHSEDPNYQNVILHVVLEADIDIRRIDGTIIPCLEIKKRVPIRLSENYQKMLQEQSWIPCENGLSYVSDIVKRQTLDYMIANRMQDRCDRLFNDLNQLDGDWEALCFHRLAWALGLRVNADNMLSLARGIPYQLIRQISQEKLAVEALLFGQSGLLPKTGGKYIRSLNKLYNAFKRENGLIPEKEQTWKFSKLRPGSFPTIRIAQLAGLISQISNLFELVITGTLPEYLEYLQVDAGPYWSSRFQFKKNGSKYPKKLGKQSLERIVINAFLPIKYLYGHLNGNNSLKEDVISILEELPSEENNITRRWKNLDFPNKDASDSQALIELKSTFCDRRRCLTCPIGHQIIVEPI